MVTPRRRARRRVFTLAQANATLPYISAIVRDITQLAHELRERHERLGRLRSGRGGLSAAHREEVDQAEAEVLRGQERMRDYEQELRQLGVELKDYFMGLIDFPSEMDGRLVYLCWRLGEPEVAHWHELEAGFAGRQKILADAPH